MPPQVILKLCCQVVNPTCQLGTLLFNCDGEDVDPRALLAHVRREDVDPRVEPGAEAIDPAPQTIDPASETIDPAFQVIDPAPEVIDPAPETINPAPEAIDPAPEAIDPAPEIEERTEQCCGQEPYGRPHLRFHVLDGIRALRQETVAVGSDGATAGTSGDTEAGDGVIGVRNDD